MPLKAEACVDPLFLGGEKYGKNGATEGGWFVCAEGFKDAPAGSCIVYSMGVNDDWSFDKAASDKYGCQVHGFDPSDAGTTHSLHSIATHHGMNSLALV